MTWILISAPLMAAAVALGVVPVAVGVLRERRFAGELAAGLAEETCSAVVLIDRPRDAELRSGWVA